MFETRFGEPGAAVIGTGFIGAVHVDALRRLGVRVTGVVGSSIERARAAGLAEPYASLHLGANAFFSVSLRTQCPATFFWVSDSNGAILCLPAARGEGPARRATPGRRRAPPRARHRRRPPC